MAPSQPHCRSGCHPSHGTYQLAAGAPHSPAAGGKVWSLPPCSLLLEVSPVRVQGVTEPLRDRGRCLCPEGATLPCCGLNLAPFSPLEEMAALGLCLPLPSLAQPCASTPSIPRHGSRSILQGSVLVHQSQLGEPSCSMGTWEHAATDIGKGIPALPWHQAAAAMAQAEVQLVGLQGLHTQRHCHPLSS